MGNTSSSVKNAWMAKNYDRVSIMLKKGEGSRLKAVAVADGVSVSRYVIDSINARSGAQVLTPLDDTSKKKAP